MSKGSRNRTIDKAKFSENFDSIDWTKGPKFEFKERESDWKGVNVAINRRILPEYVKGIGLVTEHNRDYIEQKFGVKITKRDPREKIKEQQDRFSQTPDYRGVREKIKNWRIEK